MSIEKALKKIEFNHYNIQDVFNCCYITISQLRNSDKVCTIKNFLFYLIINLEKHEELLVNYKFYYTDFKWSFTVNQIIIYAILVFYDLNNINITEKKFLNQLKREMKLYSTYNAEKRLDNLLENRKIII